VGPPGFSYGTNVVDRGLVLFSVFFVILRLPPPPWKRLKVLFLVFFPLLPPEKCSANALVGGGGIFFILEASMIGAKAKAISFWLLLQMEIILQCLILKVQAEKVSNYSLEMNKIGSLGRNPKHRRFLHFFMKITHC